ncbi:ABC transporter [Streptomyces sp. NPDC086091]|uniref:ABC transporter n=1 Tax=Streptomyces sp. NPDC086091 TaxID=3365751 RepID=UPI00382CDF81
MREVEPRAPEAAPRTAPGRWERHRPGTPPPLTRSLLRALLPPLWRSQPRRAPITAGALGLLLAASTRLPDHAPDQDLGLLVLRLAALSGAIGLAFLLDDPARHTTVTSPLGRPLRAGLRLASAVPMAALWWTAALLLVPAPTRPPWPALTLEALGMAAAALALAAAAVRFTDRAEVGRRAATHLGVAALAALLLPARWGLLTDPQNPWWTTTHTHWSLALATATLATTLCIPEPLGPLLKRRDSSPT